MTRNRGLDPTHTPCPQCPGEIIPGPLGTARHRVQHLEWMRTTTSGKRSPRNEYDTVTQLRDAWRQYASELENTVSHLNGVIGDQDDELRECRGYIEDLEADLNHVREELAAVNARLAEVVR